MDSIWKSLGCKESILIIAPIYAMAYMLRDWKFWGILIQFYFSVDSVILLIWTSKT